MKLYWYFGQECTAFHAGEASFPGEGSSKNVTEDYKGIRALQWIVPLFLAPGVHSHSKPMSQGSGRGKRPDRMLDFTGVHPGKGFPWVIKEVGHSDPVLNG